MHYPLDHCASATLGKGHGNILAPSFFLYPIQSPTTTTYPTIYPGNILKIVQEKKNWQKCSLRLQLGQMGTLLEGVLVT